MNVSLFLFIYFYFIFFFFAAHLLCPHPLGLFNTTTFSRHIPSRWHTYGDDDDYVPCWWSQLVLLLSQFIAPPSRPPQKNYSRQTTMMILLSCFWFLFFAGWPFSIGDDFVVPWLLLLCIHFVMQRGQNGHHPFEWLIIVQWIGWNLIVKLLSFKNKKKKKTKKKRWNGIWMITKYIETFNGWKNHGSRVT